MRHVKTHRGAGDIVAAELMLINCGIFYKGSELFDSPLRERERDRVCVPSPDVRNTRNGISQ